MKKLYLFMMFAVLASLGLANAATLTIWEEDFSSADCMSAYTVTGTTNTWDDNLAKGAAAPELLISKNGGSFVVNLTDLKGASGELKLTYKSNKYGFVTVSSTTANVTVGETTYEGEGAPYVNTTLITIPDGLSSLNLTFTNTNSKNARYDDFLLVKETSDGGDTPVPVVLKAPVISGVDNGAEYENATIGISFPAGATSMTWAVTKDGDAWQGGDATAAVTVSATEEGAYVVSASATNGTATVAADNVSFTIKKAVEPTIGYEAMDVANVKEGNYIIVGEHEGKYYMMKNETYMTNYVAATETTLGGSEEFSAANLFTVKKSGEGYTIQSADGKYVIIEKSTNAAGTKTYQNLRVGKDASDAVWTFADAAGKVQATYGDMTNFMSFLWYAKTGTPEFSTGYQDSHLRPAFYYVGDVKPVEPETVKVASIAEFYSKGVADADAEYEFTCPLAVTFQNGKNLYVTDGTDGLLVYGQTTATYTNGQSFAAGVKGKFGNFNGTYQLTGATLPEPAAGDEVTPRTVTVASITADTQNRYVEIKNALIDTADGVTTVMDESGSIVAFDKGFCDFPTDEDKFYDIVAMTAYFKEAVQIYPVAFSEVESLLSPGIGLSGYPLDPGSEDEIYYGDVDVNVFLPEGATSMDITVIKDGAEIDKTSATADWEKTYSELGKYTVSATATDGVRTSEPTEMEFEIVAEPVLTAPTFSLAEGTYTGTQTVTIEGYEGSMIVGTCNGEDIYDYSPCDVTLEAPATGETTYVVTVHAELGEKQGEEATMTYVIKAGEPAAEGAFTLATSADMLKEGASVILVSGNVTMSTTQNVKDVAKQFRQSTSVTVEGNTVPAVGSDVAVFTVGKDGDSYTFYNAVTKTEAGAAMPGYLCAVSNDKNALGVEKNLDDNGKWNLEFTDGKVKMLAQGDFTRNLLQFNYNGFRCYNPATTVIDTPLAIYCQVESGVGEVAADGVKVIAGEGSVRVIADSVNATVYTTAGQAVAAVDVDGETSIRLAAGFYIVRVGDAAFKVIVK